jgi:flavin reductase (DIM6/NTAB) family NADH-FMN oxidoreductase RutF
MKKSLGSKALVLPSPVWVVGSYSTDGQPNVMVVAWGGICCSEPPCVAISIQSTRLTHANISQSNAFTINVPSKDHLLATDFLGIASGKNTDKFLVTGLTPVRSKVVDAPYVKEFPIILECKVRHVVALGLHTQFIGEIMDVKAEEAVLDHTDWPVTEKVNPILSSVCNRSYYALGDCLGKAHSLGLSIVK